MLKLRRSHLNVTLFYMCGIVGYVGRSEAAPILLDGLRRLEYRGYDSAGIAIVDGEHVQTQNISIPAGMVGCIIGRGGSKISEIRKSSGARISIAKTPHDETGERMFTIVEPGFICGAKC